jgi:hypothetical protein
VLPDEQLAEALPARLEVGAPIESSNYRAKCAPGGPWPAPRVKEKIREVRAFRLLRPDPTGHVRRSSVQF